MKAKELVYMCLDLCKEFSDDSSFTEEHVLFLLNKVVKKTKFICNASGPQEWSPWEQVQWEPPWGW